MNENCASEKYYDKKGCRISEQEWKSLYSDPDYAILGRDVFDDVVIATFWLGQDLAPENEDPIIFNTNISRSNGRITLMYYATERVAKKYHNMLTFYCDQGLLENFIEWRLTDDN